MKFSVSSLIAVICFFTAVAAITDEQEAAIARLKLLMEKLSSIKRSPVFAQEKRGTVWFAGHATRFDLIFSRWFRKRYESTWIK